MTKKHSELGDNNGLCERCNREETRHQMQQAMPVYLGGGLGWGTMWCCAQCIAEKKELEMTNNQKSLAHTPAPSKQAISIIYSKDWVGETAIREELIENGSRFLLNKTRTVPEILNIPGTHLISVTQAGKEFFFYIGFEKYIGINEVTIYKQNVSVILSEDWLGGSPIKEQLIRDGEITTMSNRRTVSEILNIPGAHLISVTQAGGEFLFYIGWKK